MPIYEYECRSCGHTFEALVRASDVPLCPSCKSQDLEQLISLFAVSSAGTRQSSLASAQRKNAKIQADRETAEQRQLHDDHDHE